MNVHTFKDVVKSKRSSLANELDDGDDDDNERAVAPLRRAVEGEEDEGDERFNEAGEVLEAFNLRDERDGGHFDENMNYVFKKEKGEVDAWVAEMDEVAMEQAIGEAARAVKRKAAEREKEEERDAQKAFIPSIQLKRELLSYMKPKETVSAAMRRLSGKNDDKEKGAGIVRRRAPPSADANLAPAVQTSLQKQREKLQQQRDARAHQAAINRVSEVTDELVTRGLTGVYAMNYEALRASTLTWEYKGMDGQIYGPFTAQQLAGWKAQGFFAGPTAVQVRPVGENHASDSQPAGDVKPHADPAAAAALRAFGAPGAVDNDSIYDDDVPAAAPARPAMVQEEWRSSDEVNFGEYVNLDQAQESLRQPQRKQARPSAAATSAHSRIERALGSGGAAAAGARGAEESSDGEDSQPEAEAEGFGYRKAKSSGRKTKDLPDSDDDDDE